MPEAPPAAAETGRSGASARLLALAHAALLALLCFAVFSNAYEHEFHLDSSHVLLNNYKVRSLAFVPEFFTDPSTFSSLRANVDYRPVLQVTYALNYWMGGYNTWWWHFTQILLHLVCCVGLYACCRRILARAELPVSRAIGAWIAFVSAALFAVHPTGAGVVDYLSARSSLLTSAFLFWALFAYMRDGTRYRRTMWLSALLFALAIFSKVEAVAAVGVFLLYDCWQVARHRGHASGFSRDVLATLNLTTLRRIWPTLIVAVAYFVVRADLMSEFEFGAASRRADVTRLDYLRTQTVAWWYYVGQWFAPLGLVADHGSYEVSRSWLDGRFLLALGGWIVTGSLLAAQWRARPWLLFLGLSAAALVSPTSSVVPLAEMVNEHRPYMPIALASLAWTIPLGVGAARLAGRARLHAVVGALGTLVLLGAFGSLTYVRNEVFLTSEAFWKDVVEKAPSSRAHNNYGLVFMKRGEFESARHHFEESLRRTPGWHITHINLAIVYENLGLLERVARHFDRAVECDVFSGTALAWRGEHRLKQGQFRAALEDFEAARPKSLEYYRVYKGLATAHAGLGDEVESHRFTLECLAIEPDKTHIDIVSIADPYFRDPALYETGIAFFQRLAEQLPDTWWVWANMATLAGRLGSEERRAEWQARADTLKPSG